MKCKQCSNKIRVNFQGYCSSSCLTFKPNPKKRLEWLERDDARVIVDASDEMVMPIHFEIEKEEPKKLAEKHKAKLTGEWGRRALLKEFREIRQL